MIVPTPDLAGYADAQRRLRAGLGRDVRFYATADVTYATAPADEFDLEGIPLDPLAVPSTTNEDTTLEIPGLKIVGIVRGTVVFQPLSPTVLRSGEFQETPQGIRSRLDMAVIMDTADKPTAQNASHFQVGTNQPDGSWLADDTQLWRIIQRQDDGIGAKQRYLVTGEATE